MFPRRRLLLKTITETLRNLFSSGNLVLFSANANWRTYTYQLEPNTMYTACFEGWDMSDFTDNQKKYVWNISPDGSGTTYLLIYENNPQIFTTNDTGVVKFRYSPALSGKMNTTTFEELNAYFRIYKEG